MRFLFDKNLLTIELIGREQIWALKAKVESLKKNVLQVRYLNEFNDWRKWELRLPGTGMPGKLVAGSFWTEEGWDFLYLTNPHGWLNPIVHNVLYIETNQPKYKRIIVSCSRADADSVIAWFYQN